MFSNFVFHVLFYEQFSFSYTLLSLWGRGDYTVSNLLGGGSRTLWPSEFVANEEI
jgi:hypothetical protein